MDKNTRVKNSTSNTFQKFCMTITILCSIGVIINTCKIRRNIRQQNEYLHKIEQLENKRK